MPRLHARRDRPFLARSSGRLVLGEDTDTTGFGPGTTGSIIPYSQPSVTLPGQEQGSAFKAFQNAGLTGSVTPGLFGSQSGTGLFGVGPSSSSGGGGLLDGLGRMLAGGIAGSNAAGMYGTQQQMYLLQQQQQAKQTQMLLLVGALGLGAVLLLRNSGD